MSEERPGWTKCDGYWVKERNKGSNNNRLHFFCPHCKKITGSIDDEKLREFGFCKECYVMHVEDRNTPTIDVEYYKANFATNR